MRFIMPQIICQHQNIPLVVPVCAGLVIALVVVTRTDSGAGETSQRSGQPEVCMTEGCIGQ